MNKLLFILVLFLTLNTNANNVIKSWNSDGLVVSLCDNNKMCVGEMEYDIFKFNIKSLKTYEHNLIKVVE